MRNQLTRSKDFSQQLGLDPGQGIPTSHLPPDADQRPIHVGGHHPTEATVATTSDSDPAASSSGDSSGVHDSELPPVAPPVPTAPLVQHFQFDPSKPRPLPEPAKLPVEKRRSLEQALKDRIARIRDATGDSDEDEDEDGAVAGRGGDGLADEFDALYGQGSFYLG
jgi:hypothetical protein